VVGMRSNDKLVRRFAMVALVFLCALALNGCCGGGACPQMANMLGAGSGNCPNGACPNALQSSISGGLSGCPNGSGNCPQAGV
jgi:hypothetical protein